MSDNCVSAWEDALSDAGDDLALSPYMAELYDHTPSGGLASDASSVASNSEVRQKSPLTFSVVDIPSTSIQGEVLIKLPTCDVPRADHRMLCIYRMTLPVAIRIEGYKLMTQMACVEERCGYSEYCIKHIQHYLTEEYKLPTAMFRELKATITMRHLQDTIIARHYTQVLKKPVPAVLKHDVRAIDMAINTQKQKQQAAKNHHQQHAPKRSSPRQSGQHTPQQSAQHTPMQAMQSPVQAPINYQQSSMATPMIAPLQAPMNYQQSSMATPMATPMNYQQAPMNYQQVPMQAAPAPVNYMHYTDNSGRTGLYQMVPVAAPPQAPTQAPLSFQQAPAIAPLSPYQPASLELNGRVIQPNNSNCNRPFNNRRRQ